MSPVAITLLLFAAALHAGWNLLGKQRSPTPGLFFLANTAGTLLLALAVLWHFHPLLLQIPTKVWWALIATGAFQAVYTGALAAAYAKGDLSIVYPLARSSPIIIVITVSVLLGRGQEISWTCIGGVVLVVLGCFFLPMQRFRDFQIRKYINAACLLALAAAIGTAGYTIIDDAGLRWLRALPERGFTTLSASLVYVLAEAVTSTVWLGIYVACKKTDRNDCIEALRNQKLRAILMGAFIYLAYGLVLLSFAHVRNVSYAAAFRQVSILLGLMAGAAFLKESVPPPRWIGGLTVFAGLVLVAIG